MRIDYVSVNKELVWLQDHFVYHITEKNNMDNIMRYGLLPSLGDRSILAGDNFKAVFFFDKLYNLDNWINFLYQCRDKASLEVLRFNIKQIRCFSHNDGEEFYTKQIIPVEKIDYLEISKKDCSLIDFNDLSNQDVDYRWRKLKEYHKN